MALPHRRSFSVTAVIVTCLLAGACGDRFSWDDERAEAEAIFERHVDGPFTTPVAIEGWELVEQPEVRVGRPYDDDFLSFNYGEIFGPPSISPSEFVFRYRLPDGISDEDGLAQLEAYFTAMWAKPDGDHSARRDLVYAHRNGDRIRLQLQTIGYTDDADVLQRVLVDAPREG